MKSIILFFIVAVAAFASSTKNNPASKVYIADVEGTSTIFTPSGDVKDAEKRGVYSAEGLVFETREKSNQAMMFSNGSGIYMHDETNLEIKKFVQEPFVPNRTDLEVEPSISQTRGFVPRGYIAICTPKIVAGSSMAYESKHARINIQTIGKVAIKVENEKTEVIAVEGEFMVRMNQQEFILVRSGEKASVSKDGITTGRADKKEIEFASETTSIACNARKAVFFDVKKQTDSVAGAETEELVAVPISTQSLPVEFTISHAKIN